MRKTKIICTLGPASSDEKTMAEMLNGGMNVARLKFSHGTHENHKKTIETFRKVRDKLGLAAAIMLDTKGPEIRTGDVENGQIELIKGEKITVTTKEVLGTPEMISVTYEDLPGQLKKGNRILLDDGKIMLTVIEVEGDEIRCSIDDGGILRNKKGVNVPYIHLDMPYISKKDEEDKGKKKYLQWINRLSKYNGFEFLSKGIWKRIICIYCPIGITTLMIMPGSNSSAMLIGGTMGVILLIGGIRFKEILGLAAIGVLAIGLAFGAYKISDGAVLSRFGTFEGRISMDKSPERLLELKGSERQELLDDIRQPNAAKIAVYEGGLIGKGPGGSTQKYVVPVMFGDYMFSFLLEEYGLWGGILVIILYVSLLARGSWIARLCDSDFAQIAVGGLTLLITTQAFLHMFINVDLGPLTGQTLPLVSHGNGAFLSFCVAFGVILSISRMANKKIREEEAEAKPLIEKADDIQASMDVLESLDALEDLNFDEKN